MGTADRTETATAPGGVPKPENADWARIKDALDALDAESSVPCDRHCPDHPKRREIEKATLHALHSVLYYVMDLRAHLAMQADVLRALQDGRTNRLEWGKVIVPAAAGLAGVLVGKWL